MDRKALQDAIESNPEAIAYLTAMVGGGFLGTVPSRIAKLLGKGHRARLATFKKRQAELVGTGTTNAKNLKRAANESAFKSGLEMGLGAGGAFAALKLSGDEQGPVDYDAPRG